MRTCLPTKTGSTTWTLTLSQIAEPNKEIYYDWAYTERMAKNAIMMAEQVEPKVGELGWITLMTVRHPMARLYSAWNDKFRKGHPWLTPINYLFGVSLTLTSIVANKLFT